MNAPPTTVRNPYDHDVLAKASDTPSSARSAGLLYLRQPTVLWISAFFVGCFGYRLTLGAWSIWDAALALSLLLFWPLQEWLIHVFLLHFKPRRLGPFTLDPRNATKHRAHHRDPWRTDLIFIPLFTLIPGLPLIVIGALWISPSPALALTWLATYMLLSLHYETVHYLAHIRWRPPLKHYQRLVDAHRRHHFLSEKCWYGVSMTSGDWLLKTSPDPSTVKRSETARDLDARV